MPDRIQLLRKLVSGFHASVAKNVDPFRFPGKRRPDRIGVRTSARALLAMLRTAGPALSDPASSRLLLDLCAFRILGGRHYRLPRNLARNPRLAERIEVVEKALWSKSGEELRFSDAGPATKIGAGSIAAESISIDDFASQAGRIDFIKLDVEGAEIPVLHGARNTIRTFAPKLAVSIYHSIDDLLTIPQLLQQLDYDVYIEHATIHAEATIAFGVARR